MSILNRLRAIIKSLSNNYSIHMNIENIEEFQMLITSMVIMAPVVTAIVAMIKKTGYLPKNFTPITAAGVGAALGLIIVGASVPAGLAGLMTGLAAVGLYETGKQTKPAVVEPHSSE